MEFKISLLFLIWIAMLTKVTVFCEVISKCDFLIELRNAGIPQADWNKWLCAARMKSKMDSSWVGNKSVSVASGCSGKTYGIFQIESEYCEDDSNNMNCQRNPCRTRCNYFTTGDLQDDIRCVQDLINSRNYQSHFYGSCFGERENATEFSECTVRVKLSATTYAIILTLVFLGIILIFVAVMSLVWWKRRGLNATGLSYSEINQFKYGYNYGTINSSKRNTQTIIMEQLREREDNFSCNPYNKGLEVPTSDYEIYANEILGSGAYGIVLKGSVRHEPVAVKTVKPLSNKDYVLSLLEEIKVMSYLGRHDNITQLIGANTTLLRRGIVYVFVELCPLGSLESYIKENKSNFVDLMKDDHFLAHQYSLAEEVKGGTISSATLLLWAHQISNAMQYLATKKVIHGDLATRNVLLRSKHVAKISDFGLSRKLYTYCNYIKSKQEPLPWRYMSIEALKNMDFSTKSDVWAFGVTLWEMFTLGDLPYPGLTYSLQFADELMAGLRMPKPRYATSELFQKTMLSTWKEDPAERPSFDWLCTFLHDTLERVSSKGYIKLSSYNANNDYTNM